MPSAQDAVTTESEHKSDVPQAKAKTRVEDVRDAFGVQVSIFSMTWLRADCKFFGCLSLQENKLIDALRQLDQEHLFNHWPAAGLHKAVTQHLSLFWSTHTLHCFCRHR